MHQNNSENSLGPCYKIAICYISQPHHTIFWGLIGTISDLVGVKYICLRSMWYQFCFFLFKSNATLKSVLNLDELLSTVYYSNLFCGNCTITFTNGYIFQEQQIDPKNLMKQHGGKNKHSKNLCWHPLRPQRGIGA